MAKPVRIRMEKMIRRNANINYPLLPLPSFHVLLHLIRDLLLDFSGLIHTFSVNIDTQKESRFYSYSLLILGGCRKLIKNIT